MKTAKVMSIFGTRPEAIKMLPLVKEIERTPGLTGVVCVTAQHREMLDQVMAVFKSSADYDLNLMRPGQMLTSITADGLSALAPVMISEKPDIVLVHGDTTTSFTGALAAFYQQLPVGHVEAGLRTFDRYSPYPEEMNRCLTSQLATLHFAPTALNVTNLRREGIKEHVYQTGNTVIDALLTIVRADYTFKDPVVNQMDLSKGRLILLTAHRRENLGKPMRQIFTAIRRIAEDEPDVSIVYPVHRNPAVIEAAEELLGKHPRIHLIAPLDVEDMHNLMNKAYLVMTDSGGIQEEAPSLGKPVLVMRTETERPEAVDAGVVKVVGIETDTIYREARHLLTDPDAYSAMSQAVNPYGDGQASKRICAAIKAYFGV